MMKRSRCRQTWCRRKRFSKVSYCRISLSLRGI